MFTSCIALHHDATDATSTDSPGRMLDGCGGYGAPDADARMPGGSGGYGASWDTDSSRADSQQDMFTPPPIRRPDTFCTPNPDSTTFCLLSQWQHYNNNNPTKAKMEFVLGEHDSFQSARTRL